MSQSIFAFFDECGSTVLNAPDTESPLYVAVAVLVKKEDVESIQSQLDQIALKFRSGAEFKHAKIGKNHTLRTKILSAIGNLEFQYVALVVNKKMLKNRKGLSFRTSFYKFINRQLYVRLGRFLSGGYLKIIADQYGSKEFMDSARSYFHQYLDLLIPSVEIEYSDDKSSRLVQIADFIAGTISYSYDRCKSDSFVDGWKKILSQKEASINIFPVEYRCDNRANVAIQDEDFEASIISKAYRYLDSEDDGDDFTRARKIVLGELLNHKLQKKLKRIEE